ncbi:MAG: CaiB/BaiF CoA transferase family protein [Acidimicrobiales bacterium]
MADRALAPGPLDGVRVIDLTQALAGPFATMLLGDLGADVIKVEPPHGDMTRFSGPYAPGDEERFYGGYFASINRSKRSVVLDLNDEAGRRLLCKLVESADAVIENARAGVMDKLGVGYDVLRHVNPRLAYVAIRGFGDPRTGASPYADWPAFDLVGQAMGGVVGMTGPAGGPPTKCGPSVGDIYPGTMAALGLVSAVLCAHRTGKGQFVDIAMYDACLALCESLMFRYTYGALSSVPMSNGHPLLAPYDVYPCTDGGCVIACPLDHQWSTLCGLIGRPELADHPDYRRNRDRIRRRGPLTEAIAAWTSVRSKAQVLAELGGKVPVGPVNTAEDILADPHVAARDMLVEIDQPGVGPMTVVGTSIKMTETPTGVRRRPPILGEHTLEVLAEAGVTELPEAPEPRPAHTKGIS